MLNTKYNKFYFILLSLFIFLFDQFTKHIINLNHKSLVNKDLILFSLDYVKNFGAAFNLFSGNRIFLTAISLIITIVILYIILNKNNMRNIDY